jgi:hypothetical protein
MASRVDAARKVVGRPLTLWRKFYTATFGMVKQSKLMEEELIMLILLQIGSLSRCTRKWRCYNLCMQVKKQLLFQLQYIVIHILAKNEQITFSPC